jgi:hypothetical protein
MPGVAERLIWSNPYRRQRLSRRLSE